MHGNIQLQENPIVNRDWYALLVESGKERKASDWLEIRQFQPYWPRYKGTVKLNRHRRAMRLRSVIPGYLFLPLGHDANWRLILSKEAKAKGIREVLRNGQADYARLNDGHIDSIRNIEIALNSSALCAVEGIPFKVGQFIRLIAGAFSGIEGKIIQIDKGRRITLESFMFGRTTRMTVTASEIDSV